MATERSLAMGELFLAAERLHRAPTDVRWIGSTVADVVDGLAPCGVSAADSWRVQYLTGEVVMGIDTSDDDGAAVVTHGRAPSDFLRDFV